MLHIATDTGMTVQLHRTHLIAQHGPHAGRRFRIDGVKHDGRQHMVIASRKHSSKIRHSIRVLPDVFGLVISEVEEITRELISAGRIIWGKITSFADGLYIGTLALIPLAYFEHYDLSTRIVESINSMISLL